MTSQNKIRHLVLMALFAAQAVVLHIFESFIPVPFIFPGARLGLANIVTVSALYLMNPLEVAGVIITRVLIASIFAGSMLSFLYSISGALLSFTAMAVLKKLLAEKAGLIGISCTGAVFHNVGQLLVASVLIGNIRIMSYLPFLSFLGIITGAFVGIASFYLIGSTKRFFSA